MKQMLWTVTTLTLTITTFSLVSCGVATETYRQTATQRQDLETRLQAESERRQALESEASALRDQISKLEASLANTQTRLQDGEKKLTAEIQRTRTLENEKAAALQANAATTRERDAYQAELGTERVSSANLSRRLEQLHADHERTLAKLDAATAAGTATENKLQVAQPHLSVKRSRR